MKNEKMCGWKRQEKIWKTPNIESVAITTLLYYWKNTQEVMTHTRWIQHVIFIKWSMFIIKETISITTFYSTCTQLVLRDPYMFMGFNCADVKMNRETSGITRNWSTSKFHLQRIKFKASSWEQKNTIYYTLAILVCPADTKSFHLYLI